jgi:hypothetical protein
MRARARVCVCVCVCVCVRAYFSLRHQVPNATDPAVAADEWLTRVSSTAVPVSTELVPIHWILGNAGYPAAAAALKSYLADECVHQILFCLLNFSPRSCYPILRITQHILVNSHSHHSVFHMKRRPVLELSSAAHPLTHLNLPIEPNVKLLISCAPTDTSEPANQTSNSDTPTRCLAARHPSLPRPSRARRC